MIQDGDEQFVAICFWGSGDWRREGGAFSFLVKGVAAAPFSKSFLGFEFPAKAGTVDEGK